MIKAFQGFRLLGIITIIAGHLGAYWWGAGDWCSFFFIISGFLYKADIKNYIEYKNYIVRKAKSIFPAYWFVLLLFLALAFFRNCPEQYEINRSFLAHFFLLQSWIPKVDPCAYVIPAWFLSSLWFCYLIGPLFKKVILWTKWSILFIAIIAFFLKECTEFDTYFSPIFRSLEYSFGLWLGQYLYNIHKVKEPFPLFCLMVITLFLIGLYLSLIPFWIEIILFGLIIIMISTVKSTTTEIVFGNKYIVSLSKADMFIFLSHPGIGFHVVFLFKLYDPISVVIGSIIIGYLLYLSYDFLCQTLPKYIKAKSSFKKCSVL